jgi:glycerol kinase
MTISRYIMAIDAGTTGVRCRAVFVDGQEVVAAYREFTQHFPEPGVRSLKPLMKWSPK